MHNDQFFLWGSLFLDVQTGMGFLLVCVCIWRKMYTDMCGCNNVLEVREFDRIGEVCYV